MVQGNREQIHHNQLHRLNEMLAAILPGNRFYRNKLHLIGAGGPFEDLESFSRTVPFTTKDELVTDQETHPPFGTNLTFGFDRYVRFHQTSGTSGRPLRWLDTPVSWDWMLQNWLQVYRASGVGPQDRCFFAFSYGPFLGFWTAFEAAQKLGCLCLPGGGMSSLGRLEMIADHMVNVVCCTPTYALHLGRIARDQGMTLALSGVERILVAGEPGGSLPEVRAAIGHLWPNATVYDHHGMTEVGPVSYQDPDHPDQLRIIESAYLAEVIDPQTGEASDIGEEGELVLTTLGRTGSPLIRYRTGDLVRVHPESLGGGDLALDGGILGRVDDMVIVRGVNLYPAAFDRIVRTFHDVEEYRVQILDGKGLAEIKMEIEPKRDTADPEDLCDRIAEALYTIYQLRVVVTAVAEETLPRFELKARRWLRTTAPTS